MLVYGAGGHAKVVLDVLAQQGVPVLGCLDDASALWGGRLAGVRVVGGLEALEGFDPGAVRCLVAVGDNRIRQRVVARLDAWGARYVRAIHLTAAVASSARVERGCVLMAQVAVNPDAVVERHAIVNTGCTVDHDCIVEAFAHLSPGTHLAGGVRVGQGAHLGVGVSVIPGVTIGAWAVVGAGAAVVRDVPPGVVAVGVPARELKRVPTPPEGKRP